MNASLWFVVPVHERLRLAGICLRQLRRTCDKLTAEGIDATAVLIADAENLAGLSAELGEELLGFATVCRDNTFLSRKYNDGIQLALDKRHNPHPAGYVVPCGSDDWVDHRLFLNLPDPRTVVGFQRMSFVREDGLEITTAILNYQGGAGIRIYPAPLLEPFGYRPADEDRRRACDMSILTHLRLHHGDKMQVEHRHLHDRQIVDWKSPGTQLNTYETIRRQRRGRDATDPFTALKDFYPQQALREMRDHYATALRQAA